MKKHMRPEDCTIARRWTLLSLAFSLAGLLAACKPAEEAKPAETPTISGQTVNFPGRVQGIRSELVEETLALGLKLPGRLTWNEDRTVRVFSPFAGRVLRATVNVGDHVRQGQALAEMTSADFDQTHADARRAATDLRLAQQNLSRAQELTTAGIMAQKDLNQSQAEFDRATTENARATSRLNQAGGGTGGNYVLKSPINGIVVEKTINPGQELRPDQQGAPQFVITDPAQLWILMDAPESSLSQLARLPVGTGLAVVSNAWPEKTFKGRLTQSADFLDPASRTFRLRGTVDNTERLLKAEMFVNAAIDLPRAPVQASQSTVTSSAILFEGAKNYIIVQKNANDFERVTIKVEREHAGRTTVTGLAPGSRVVTEGNLYIQQMLQTAARNTIAPAPGSTPVATPAAAPAGSASPADSSSKPASN